MTDLIFVRHGEADGNIKRFFQGFYNSSLTENGRVQIRRAAERLKSVPFDAIYSSDLTRAYETACTVNEGRGLEIQIDERFREIHGGDWEDVPWDDLPIHFPDSYSVWLDEPHNLQMPNGESMRAFSERLQAATLDVIRAHPNETVCIATHGTAIRVLTCWFRHWPLERLNDVNWCDNASITHVQYDDGRFTLLVDGDNEHLKDISTIEKQNWWSKK